MKAVEIKSTVVLYNSQPVHPAKKQQICPGGKGTMGQLLGRVHTPATLHLLLLQYQYQYWYQRQALERVNTPASTLTVGVPPDTSTPLAP
jgi:hypothetical protein